MCVCGATGRRKLTGVVQIISGNPYILTINGQRVTIEERYTGLNDFGSREFKQHIEYLLWDWCVCAAALQMRLPKWDFNAITKLSFVGVRLREFHVGPFRCLKTLNLSRNMITSLMNRGLEYCDRMEVFDVSDNQLRDDNELSVFGCVFFVSLVGSAGNRPVVSANCVCVCVCVCVCSR